MSDAHETLDAIEAEDTSPVWPLRPMLLALLGLATGYAVHLIIGELSDDQLTATKLSILAFITVTAGLIGFTIERRLWWASILFSAAMGAIAAGVVWWSGGPDGWSGGDGWRGVSLLLAIAIAAPLFQAARDEGRLRFPYASVHDHAWTNVVLWGACWLFVGITFALSYLLAGLFDLIKLSFLSDLLRKDWFWRVLIGAAFGGALGIFREHDGVVRMLQRVVLTVLSVLAPVLAAGLIIFVLALPFTGLAPLWEAGSATGILLACIVGSLILANSVIGNKPGEERNFPLLKYGAMGLALVMLPLGVIAAIAIGLRIGQYGFTPERLWALTFVIMACAYGLAYLVSLLRGRLDWAAKVRPANLHLAFATCAVALLLATPLVSFNAIATHDQVARLESGRTPPGKFDWRALAFSFGEPGRAALDKLKSSTNAAIRERAITVSRAESPYVVELENETGFTGSYDMHPAGSELPDALKKVFLQDRVCQNENLCRVYLHDAKTATIIDDGCSKLAPEKRSDPKDKCMARVETYLLTAEGWKDVDNLTDSTNPEAKPLPGTMSAEEERVLLEREYGAISGGNVTVRNVELRQVYVGDKPEGRPFK